MLNFLKAKVAGVIAITTMVWPAYAQFGQFDPNTILAKDSRPLAGYYAPYGMLALTPYYRGHLAKGDNAQAVVNSMFKPENFDVNYIIAQSKSEGHPVTLTDIVNGAMAPDALGPWHYEFGSNAKDVCYDGELDSYCWAHRPHWWQRHYPGPTFQVWSKRDTSHESGRTQSNVESCSEVSIGFRGTELGNYGDEISNARVFREVEWGYDTSYTWLRRNIDAILRHIPTTIKCYQQSKPPIIVSVGHSLGGGLAQLAALANDPKRTDNVRIDKVFAFEPSPDTGGDLVEDGLRTENSKGLEIDRVGQVEDVSVYLHVAAQYLPTLSRYIPGHQYFIRQDPNEFFPGEVAGRTCDPALRHVRFDEQRKPNPVELHHWTTTVAQFIYIRKIEKEAQETGGGVPKYWSRIL
jgi:pimeloyl-ACP methyl ester carboxylesterase